MRPSPYDAVAVWGAGKSGWAVARLFAKAGADVSLYDDRQVDEFKQTDTKGIHLRGGGLTWENESLVVLSPGIRPSSGAIRRLIEAEQPYMSEIEAALLLTDIPVIAVTGTDGKSTTSAMIDHVLRSDQRRSVVCGNFGVPLSSIIAANKSLDFLVVEISAFQLWSTHIFRPCVALITNIAEDHLEYFDQSLEAYREAKLRIFRDMKTGSVVVRQDLLADLTDDIPEAVDRQSFDVNDQRADWYLDGDHLLSRSGVLMRQASLRVVGRHNVANALSTAAALTYVGLTLDQIANGLSSFGGLPHRMEFVRRLDEVDFYNDSKATNPHAAMSGLQAMDENLIVIAGGYDKGLELEPFADLLGRQKHVLLTGPAGEKLAHLLREHPHCQLVSGLHEALIAARGASAPGDAIVLCPGSSSFDAFESFEHRGEVFKQLVRAL